MIGSRRDPAIDSPRSRIGVDQSAVSRNVFGGASMRLPCRAVRDPLVKRYTAEVRDRARRKVRAAAPDRERRALKGVERYIVRYNVRYTRLSLPPDPGRWPRSYPAPRRFAPRPPP